MVQTDEPQLIPSVSRARRFVSGIPLFGWLLGILAAVLLERYLGDALTDLLDLPKIPVLFGFVNILKKPALMPGSLIFTLIIYVLPIGILARATAPVANAASDFLIRRSVALSAVVHLALLYLILHIWADVSAYRVLILKLTLISIMITLSLNVVNGYMGEFSCSHPGFLALGAYACSVFTVGLFVNDRIFGEALLPSFLAPYFFPVGLILGGVAAAVGALFVAIPSFRTRGDYLAIISLAFMFIVKSLIENLEFVGGPRGLGSQPDMANLPVVFIWTVLCVWIINNFVRSTLGKALNAVRDDELAADAMTVNTRRTKMTAF
ncbi:MAG: branched-chain amino acid ABC transporter permease, partial [Deltaproteobacteria bacterium]|nr:branched-chain amino acid ABC transporter permease [Deltaproteobacteria bacterium]